MIKIHAFLLDLVLLLKLLKQRMHEKITKIWFKEVPVAENPLIDHGDAAVNPLIDHEDADIYLKGLIG